MDRYHRELCAYLAGFLTPHKRDILPRLLLNRTRHITVVVEDVYQPHNASACLRSCDCFGVQDVYVVESRNEYQVNVDVALGASRWLTLHRYGDTTDCLTALKARGYALVTTSPHDSDCELESYDIARPTALVFGNEKDGISRDARSLSDHSMRIPMYGFTESFNISVAVAIFLHHLVWRMRQSNVAWRLSDEEREALLLEWVRTASGARRENLEERFRELWSADPPPLAELWPDWSQIPQGESPKRANRAETRNRMSH